MQVVSRFRGIVAVGLFLLTIVPAATAKYSGGTGEPNDPYQIATATDLIALGEAPEDYDKHFILTADIDLDPNLPGRKVFDKAVIAPDWETPFTGVFDGNQHKIANLVVAGSKNVGLFGGLGPGAEVRDLGVVNVDATSSHGPLGALVGYNWGYVNRCYCTGQVHAYAEAGGLVGWNAGTVTASYSTASVSGSFAGGLIGGNGGYVAHSYCTGTVDGKWCVGGLVATNNNGVVLGCYSTGAVSSSYESYIDAGGLVGTNGGVVSISYSTGPVRATGRSPYDSCVGGLLGTNHRDVTQCYATGAVSAGPDDEIGGLVGHAQYGSSMTSCFWDVQTSGTTRMCGAGSGTVGCSDEYGKLTAQMRDVRTYLQAGWDFVGESPNGLHEAWQMPEPGGYPVLAIFNGYAPPALGGTGTLQDPYLISSALELGAMIHYSPHAHYRLSEAIDLSGVRWGLAIVPLFGGAFDGNSLTISHLTIRGQSRAGLFGRVESGAQVTDLGVVDVNIIGSGAYVGALVGQNDGEVRRCYSGGAVRGESEVGGLVGVNEYSGGVSECYSTGVVSGNWAVGGLVGEDSRSITTSYSSASVDGNSAVGGLVGSCSGRVTDCYAAGAANGEEAVGGLVGRISAWYGGVIVVRCYGTAVVSGNHDVGGLVGDVCYRKAGVLASVWDMETSAQSGSDAGVGLTTGEMMDPYMLGLNGFSNDPNWVLDPGRDYPRLAWQGTPGDIIPEPEIDWLEGSGSAESPYRIDSPEQLIMLGKASILWDRSFVLCADINLDPNLPNVPVFGQAVMPVLTGVFDGGGHTIANLTIRGGSHLGLFGQIEAGAEVRSLALMDVNVVGRGYDIGALAGSNAGKATGCSSTGVVSGGYHVGGLVGNNAISPRGMEGLGAPPAIPGTVMQCFSTAVVFGTGSVGGLAGFNPSDTGRVVWSYSDGRVSGNSVVGGLVGMNLGYVTQCYSQGAVTGISCLGGLVGANFDENMEINSYSGYVTTCYSTGSVARADTGGGLVGCGDEVDDGFSSFWDIETSGQTTSDAGTGKTTAEMQMASTFLDAGWDFAGETANGTEDIWWMLEGKDYPRLWWERVLGEDFVLNAGVVQSVEPAGIPDTGGSEPDFESP